MQLKLETRRDYIQSLLDAAKECIKQTELCMDHGDAFQAYGQLKLGDDRISAALGELSRISIDALEQTVNNEA